MCVLNINYLYNKKDGTSPNCSDDIRVVVLYRRWFKLERSRWDVFAELRN